MKNDEWTSSADVGGSVQCCSIWFFICNSFISPGPQRQASKKKLMKIADYRRAKKVTVPNHRHILRMPIHFHLITYHLLKILSKVAP